jgi:hypothetical protein
VVRERTGVGQRLPSSGVVTRYGPLLIRQSTLETRPTRRRADDRDVSLALPVEGSPLSTAAEY